MSDVRIELLADHPDLIGAVGEIRWKEWGHPPEPVDLSFWVDITSKESGRTDLPVTWVAIDQSGEVNGAVAIGEFDIEERRDASPWVLGMIVRDDLRGEGIGRKLLRQLEAWAVAQGYPEVWVATGGPATGFYERCGWLHVETFVRDDGQPATILLRRF